MRLPPIDKQAHALAGYALAVTFGAFSPWLGLIVAVVAGGAKEWHDYLRPGQHTADWADFYFTALGGLAGAVFWLILR